MFDSMLGNIFGRSKKHSSANIKDNAKDGHKDEHTDAFVVVGASGTPTAEATSDEPKSLYPQMTILRQEQFVGQNSNSSLVFAAHRTAVQTYSSPIDNVPFASLTASGHNDLLNPNSTSVTKCFETIDRVQQYLSSKSQSEYNFQLENTILSESLLS